MGKGEGSLSGSEEGRVELRGVVALLTPLCFPNPSSRSAARSARRTGRYPTRC